MADQDDDQPGDDKIKTDDQPDDQANKDKKNDDDSDDDFDPKMSAKDYAKKWRDASAEAAKNRKELAKIKADKDKSDKAALKEQGKYKEMYDSLNGEHSKLKGFLEGASRSQAFRAEAVKQGCKPELVELLEKSANLAEIELDDKYRPDKEQVAFEVDQLRDKYGAHFFQKEAKKPKDGTPKKTEGKLTYEQWKALPLAEKKKRMSEVINSEE